MVKDKVLQVVWVSKVSVKQDGKWQLTFKTIDGKKHTRTRVLQADLETERNKLLKMKVTNLAIPNDRKVKKYDGSVKWYLDLLGQLSKELAEKPNSELRQDIKAIAQVASSVAKLYDYSAMEDRMNEMDKTIEEYFTIANRTK